jgi:hypothetical protein
VVPLPRCIVRIEAAEDESPELIDFVGPEVGSDEFDKIVSYRGLELHRSNPSLVKVFERLKWNDWR